MFPFRQDKADHVVRTYIHIESHQGLPMAYIEGTVLSYYLCHDVTEKQRMNSAVFSLKKLQFSRRSAPQKEVTLVMM